jgi:hypothetical protein
VTCFPFRTEEIQAAQDETTLAIRNSATTEEETYGSILFVICFWFFVHVDGMSQERVDLKILVVLGCHEFVWFTANPSESI